MRLQHHVILASTFLGGFTAVLCVAALNGCARFGDNLAIVNGQTIPMDEFYQYLQHKAQVKVQTESGVLSLPVSGSLGFQALQDLVDRRIESQIAKEKGLYPTESDLDLELKRRLTQDPGFEEGLIEDGLTIKAIKDQIRAQLVEDRLLTQGVSVSESETEVYIRSHLEEFVEPARAEFSYIFVQDAGAERKVDDELATGQSFSSVALRCSESPTARAFNGKYSDPGASPPAISSLPSEIQAALSKLKDDETSAWFATNGGFAKIYLEKLHPSRQIPITDAKKGAVRRKLLLAKGQQVNDLAAMVQAKLRQSKIEVFPESYKSSWKALEDAGS